jgi:dTDP-4-amino-4,6-dideoxygalactose transaminase
MGVPFMDLPALHAPLKDEILEAWGSILDTAGFIGGPHVEELERNLAKEFGSGYSVSLNSGTDALRLGLQALGLSPGDEVITVSGTFIATSEAISQAGGKPVFVDIDPDYYTMDPASVESAITDKTRCIIPVHLYGQPADMDPLLEIAGQRNLHVLEDACQAHLSEYKGKKAGTIGDAGALSFYPGKNLGACGDAGAILSDDEDLVIKCKMLRDHGQIRKYHHEVEGYNARCDALQAAALNIKLRYLSAWNTQRRHVAACYHERLLEVDGIKLPAERQDAMHVYHLYVVMVPQRDKVLEGLHENGIQAGLHYPIPLHLQKAYTALGYHRGSFPVSEKLADAGISLPIYPGMSEEQVDQVCDSLKKVLEGLC